MKTKSSLTSDLNTQAQVNFKDSLKTGFKKMVLPREEMQKQEPGSTQEYSGDLKLVQHFESFR